MMMTIHQCFLKIGLNDIAIFLYLNILTTNGATNTKLAKEKGKLG